MLDSKYDVAYDIRLAEAEDVDGIFHVRTSVRENLLTVDELTDLGITPTVICDMIRAQACAWVAVRQGDVIGFSMINVDEACLFAAFVLPAYEGRGVGTRLVRCAEAALFAQHEQIWLETRKDSRAAAFYRHLGWGCEKDAVDGDIRLEKRRSPGNYRSIKPLCNLAPIPGTQGK